MKPLRKRMFDALVLRNFPARTIDAYIDAVAALTRHYRVSPVDGTGNPHRFDGLGR